MRFLIFGNTSDSAKAGCIRSLIETLGKHDVQYAIEPHLYTYLARHAHWEAGDSHLMTGGMADGDIAMSIGGDGTFLRTARAAAQGHIPIIGVNMGRMGFLTDIEPATFGKAVSDILRGDYHIEERTQLALTVSGSDGTRRCTALNEIAVTKMDISSMISIRVKVNGQFLSTYQCDGLIVATSTGSTAYSLSVGGPIIMPQSESMVITPVAPHNLSVRPIVLRDDWTVEMEVASRNRQFLVANDGASMACDERDKLTVTKADESLKVVKLNSHPLFENLRSKLMLGVDNRGGSENLL